MVCLLLSLVSLLSLEVATTENKSVLWTLSSICESASKAVFSGMQLTLHATRPTPCGASRLVQTMRAWSVKTRRVPSRHCRDAKVYGHTIRVMHDMSTPPPSWTHLVFFAVAAFADGCGHPVNGLHRIQKHHSVFLRQLPYFSAHMLQGKKEK